MDMISIKKSNLLHLEQNGIQLFFLEKNDTFLGSKWTHLKLQFDTLYKI